MACRNLDCVAAARVLREHERAATAHAPACFLPLLAHGWALGLASAVRRAKKPASRGCLVRHGAKQPGTGRQGETSQTALGHHQEAAECSPLLRAALAWLAAPESDLDERGLEFVQSFGFLCSRLGARMRMPLPLVPALALGIPARIQSRRPRPCV